MDPEDVKPKLEKIRDLHLETGNGWLASEDISSEYSNIESDDLRVLLEVNYLERKPTDAEKYTISEPGTQFIRDQETISQLEASREVNERLIRQSKISSAAETIFTYALITFSYIQVMNTELNPVEKVFSPPFS